MGRRETIGIERLIEWTYRRGGAMYTDALGRRPLTPDEPWIIAEAMGRVLPTTTADLMRPIRRHVRRPMRGRHAL